jgi:quinoprotein glucose dehydrogenase
VTQVTKTGFAFVFHRVTGGPLFPVEERAVPPRDVPGEQAWPTQPFPLKPPPFARQSMRPDELTDVTPDSRAFCAKLMEGAVLGGLYTPIGLRPTILFPGTNGGVAAPLTMKACMDCHGAKRAALACNACHELGQ